MDLAAQTGAGVCREHPAGARLPGCRGASCGCEPIPGCDQRDSRQRISWFYNLELKETRTVTQSRTQGGDDRTAFRRSPPSSSPPEGSADAALVPAASEDAARDWRSRVVNRSLGLAADKAVQRGQAFISAASRLIRGGDAKDLTMQKVAAEAGLSLRVLYQHFASKDDLLVALVEEAERTFTQLMRQRVEQYTEPLDRLGAALYFATDKRLHTDEGFNRAMASYTMQAAVVSPEQLGRARRPVTQFFAELIDKVMRAGLARADDPENAAVNLLLTYVNYQTNIYLGNFMGGPLPSSESLIRFCLAGLGVEVEEGWNERFRLSEEDIVPYKEKVERYTSRPRKRRAD
ncbi:hypothetical protein GCM10009555_096730 [Acrocarpospora macrocephala]|uniref:HTH tetR-type domain-containing protein n=1 Tax=Acrocarpospora macrocephala TaxID=150177 RepID=A0A5M3WMT7_9ACTN|nr:TetR/AcrR family transcriptional regulator [Acrocarpospora macrocephala]GES09382.1 hypothetical protein Amac_029780 [Acrocarpospora macrocephala]